MKPAQISFAFEPPLVFRRCDLCLIPNGKRPPNVVCVRAPGGIPTTESSFFIVFLDVQRDRIGVLQYPGGAAGYQLVSPLSAWSPRHQYGPRMLGKSEVFHYDTWAQVCTELRVFDDKQERAHPLSVEPEALMWTWEQIEANEVSHVNSTAA